MQLFSQIDFKLLTYADGHWTSHAIALQVAATC
jgi:hypothetical protein